MERGWAAETIRGPILHEPASERWLRQPARTAVVGVAVYEPIQPAPAS